MKDAHVPIGFKKVGAIDVLGEEHLHFWEKTDFFLPFLIISRFCRLIVVLGGAADPSVDHISAISTSKEIIFSRSSSV